MLRVLPTALAFAAFFAIVHAVWALAVYLQWAQPFLDFIFGLHFITPPYRVEAFEIGRAGMLVGETAAVGLVSGAVFAVAWNIAHGGAQRS